MDQTLVTWIKMEIEVSIILLCYVSNLYVSTHISDLALIKSKLTKTFPGFDMDNLLSDTGNGTMCLICNKVLAYRHDARRHIRMKHSGNSEVTCNLCGKKSKHRWSHADHMRQKHGYYSKPNQ